MSNIAYDRKILGVVESEMMIGANRCKVIMSQEAAHDIGINQTYLYQSRGKDLTQDNIQEWDSTWDIIKDLNFNDVKQRLIEENHLEIDSDFDLESYSSNEEYVSV